MPEIAWLAQYHAQQTPHWHTAPISTWTDADATPSSGPARFVRQSLDPSQIRAFYCAHSVNIAKLSTTSLSSMDPFARSVANVVLREMPLFDLCPPPPFELNIEKVSNHGHTQQSLPKLARLRVVCPEIGLCS
jgi:hypothetical protein